MFCPHQMRVMDFIAIHLGRRLGKNVQETITHAHPYPEGRWLFILVESEEDAGDIRRLLALRAETKRLMR